VVAAGAKAVAVEAKRAVIAAVKVFMVRIGYTLYRKIVLFRERERYEGERYERETRTRSIWVLHTHTQMIGVRGSYCRSQVAKRDFLYKYVYMDFIGIDLI